MENKKGKRQKKDKLEISEPGIQDEEKFLGEVISHVTSKLRSGKYQVKIADAIRAIEVRQKMKSKDQKKSKEKVFWELIDQIRKEELPK